ncbi:lactococcin 972 family bacteriocin [Rathayibacter sp. VKM Ac-2754]|uniref:lactococcin 972 family bacteriocin n=1 Tax=Rathayibacter sp. VKM Ac-2754 TaxID=2609251 RepID=UPI00135BB86A|nr:lactococcin 972 family bacteriocin [Rathayibacter sp. VKM Ac-2754]MWV58896.1 lactococcin 972 family bacteriocin [Rathayibacter sp. VKM Ac-2754]
MNWKKLGVSVAIIAGSIAGVGAVATSAAADGIEYPAGGTWYYGAGGKTVYSHYYNNGRTHKATACGAYDASGACEYTGWKSPGTPALANQPVKLSGNTAYWDVL